MQVPLITGLGDLAFGYSGFGPSLFDLVAWSLDPLDPARTREHKQGSGRHDTEYGAHDGRDEVDVDAEPLADRRGEIERSEGDRREHLGRRTRRNAPGWKQLREDGRPDKNGTATPQKPHAKTE